MPHHGPRERADTKRKAPAKTFQCSVCSRSFARLEHLKRHDTTHTNEKSFVCFCGRSFARKDLLKRHEQTGRHLISTPSSTSTAEPQNAPSTSGIVATLESIASGDLVTATCDVNQAQLADFPGPSEPSVDQYMFDSNAYQNFDTFLSTMGLNIPYELGNVSMFFNETVTHHANSHMHKGLDASTDEPSELRPYVCPYKITDLQRQRLDDTLLQYKDSLGSFTLPSRLSLSRHLTGYIEDYHNHLPFLHHIAFRNSEREHAPHLLLAVLASGAMSKYEVNTACRLFRASKLLTLAHWNTFKDVVGLDQAHFQGAEQMETVQAAHLLTVFAMMHCKSQASQMTAELRDILEQYVRSSASFATDGAVSDWVSFVHVESGRRTLCAVFCALNMYTMMFDAAPLALSANLDTKLPCSTAEWTATNEREWLAAQAVAPEQIQFRVALSALFTGRNEPHLHSAFANLVLMHAILQRLFLLRQIDMERCNGPLSESSLNELEPALERWMSVWHKAPESILDPRNPDGSNSFTSASYLGLAYIRMYTDYASKRQLSTWNPDLVASNLFRAPIPQRSPRLGPALLHAMESLYIPIKTGIAYSARSHFLHWDIQNFLCKLEVCAFLTKWLISVANSCDVDPISDCESNIIRVLRRVIREAEETLDPEDGSVNEMAMGGTPDLLRHLAVRVAHTWSCLFRNHNGSWAMIDLIGQSLQKYAALLADSFAPGHTT